MYLVIIFLGIIVADASVPVVVVTAVALLFVRIGRQRRRQIVVEHVDVLN